MKNERKKLILTVDDDPATRKYFKTLLSKSGFSVLEAKNADEGLSIIKEKRPDLVLLDLRMPGKSGLEVLKELTEKHKEIAVIVVSATGLINDVVESLRLGAWDFIVKPLPSYDILIHQINKVLERSTLKAINKQYQVLLEEALKKLQVDLEAGKNIQSKLLPQNNVSFGKYHFESLILPSLYLSGDFVDYFQIDNDHIAFYIADISGHGISSALVTVLLKSFITKEMEDFQSGYNKNILDPANLLNQLNKELIAEQLGKFSTIFYGVINNKKNILTYSNAGHYPLPVIKLNGNTEQLEFGSVPVGISKETRYKNKKIILKGKFRLTFFSDGILDILPQDMLDDKITFLNKLSLNDNENFNYFISELKENAIGLPDDISVLKIEN